MPVVRGLIERRVLVNYRVDREVVAAQLPSPFRPQIVGGFAIAGVCLIRLKSVRPRRFPSILGIASEYAAHRFAVEWDLPEGRVARGVYIPRRDSNSWLNTLAGGRFFPGIHRHARFQIDDRDDRLSIEIESDDREIRIGLIAHVAESLSRRSVFETLDKASDFFAAGSVGFSDSRSAGRYEGLELRTSDWSMAPLDVERLESSFFNDRRRFPPGAVQFDSALLMRRIKHEWLRHEPLVAPPFAHKECGCGATWKNGLKSDVRQTE